MRRSTARDRKDRTDEEVVGKRGSRKKLGLLAGAVVAVIAIAAGVVWFSPLFVVKQVNVEGAVHADVEAIKQTSGIELGQKLVSLDTTGAARSVAGEPWVNKVTVSRSWPSSATVQIEEYVPALFMRATDGDHLFSDTGREFVTAPPPPGTVELIEAPRVDQPEDGKIDPEPAVVEAALKVLKALPESIRGRVEAVSAPSPAEVRILLHDGFQVYFGSADNVEEKVKAAEIVLKRGEKNWDVSSPQMPVAKGES